MAGGWHVAVWLVHITHYTHILTISDATELEIGELSQAELYFSEPSLE